MSFIIFSRRGEERQNIIFSNIKFLRRNEKEGKKKPRESGSFKTTFVISKYIVREKIECG